MKTKVVLSILLLSSALVKAAHPIGSAKGLACDWSAIELTLAQTRAIEVMLDVEQPFSLTAQGLEAHVRVGAETIIVRGRDDLKKFARVGKAELELRIQQTQTAYAALQAKKQRLNPQTTAEQAKIDQSLRYAKVKNDMLHERVAHLDKIETAVRN